MKMNTPRMNQQESPITSDLPAISDDEADVPREEAICLQFMDSSLSESDASASSTSRTGSPASLSSAIKKELGGGVDLSTPNVITEKMVVMEQCLEEERMKKEAERQKQMQLLVNEEGEDAQLRYDRLKFLLSKSTMYTQYLVDRMRKQKEEQEERRQRMLKRKAKMEGKKKAEVVAKAQNAEAEPSNLHNTRKRRPDKDDNIDPAVKKRTKRERKVVSSSQENSQVDDKYDGHSVKSKLDAEDLDKEEVPGENVIDKQKNVNDELDKGEEKTEPELLEKAVTFGVDDNEDNPRIINGEEVPMLQPHLMEGGVLRSYQVEGYSWLKVLYENGVNGILADEMGLGKTVQCVALLSHLVQMGVPGPYLVCAPLSTIPNWLSEIQRFAPKVPTILYHGTKEQRVAMAGKIKRFHKVKSTNEVRVKPVVITSYEMAIIDRRILGRFDWSYLIVDEGHRIKNTHCRLIKELRMYQSTHRLLLTGTPLQNNLAELWSLLNFLLPEIFDDKGSFESWFDANCMGDATSEEQILKQEQGKNILSMLHQILSPFMLRRLKSDVDLCIPPKKEVLVYAPLTKHQREFYSALVDRSIFSFIDEKNGKKEESVVLNAAGYPKRRSASRIIDYSTMMENESDKKMNEKKSGASSSRWKDLEKEEKELESWILAVNDMKSSRKSMSEDRPKSSQVTIKMRNVMMQLRKCCNHPYLLEHPLDPKNGELALTEGVVKSSGKMLVLDQMLRELKKLGHKVLIFSQMTRMLDLIEDFCQIRGYDFCRLDGSTSVDDRRDSMNIFNEKETDKFVFLLSTRAGGLGINLTGADTVIIYDSDWNPQCDLQAQDRCHRIGQTKPVVVYRFVTANTIDQKIIERAANKRKLEKMVIHKGSFKSGNFINRAKPIDPEELKELLNSKDHCTEVKNDKFVISKTEMDALLNRSDLYAQWERSKQKSNNNSDNSGEKACHKKGKKSNEKTKEQSSDLFKIIDIDDSSSTRPNTESQTCSDGEASEK